MAGMVTAYACPWALVCRFTISEALNPTLQGDASHIIHFCVPFGLRVTVLYLLLYSLSHNFFVPVRDNCIYTVVYTRYFKGVTPRGWFVSEVLGRPEDGTRDSSRFPISQDFWGGWKGGSRRRVARGRLGSSSCPPPVGR